jgi:transmembrane sensor
VKRRSPKSTVRAEAAIWLSRLRSEERTPDVEAGFRAWLHRGPEHQAAFDLVNTAWELVGRETTPQPRSWRVNRLPVAAAIAIVFATVTGAIVWTTQFRVTSEAYETGFGEQRRIALADGSLILLDTSTSVQVSMSRRKRSVELLHGRAHFEVAKDETRPFAVDTGDRRIIAVGTVFDVDRETGLISVLLTRGKVLVENNTDDSRMLLPGERLAFEHGQVIADRPDLEVVTSWQSGRAVFKRRPLKDVLAEFNRYSRQKLELTDPQMGDIPISGNYQTGNNEEFAAALSGMLPLDVETVGDRIILKRRKAPTAGEPVT